MRLLLICVAALAAAVGTAGIALHESYWQGLALIGIAIMLMICVDVLYGEES